MLAVRDRRDNPSPRTLVSPGLSGLHSHICEPGQSRAPGASSPCKPRASSPHKPRAQGWAMNGLPAGTSVPGRGRSATELTCGDARGRLGVRPHAGVPGLQGQQQQQQREPPHLRPLQGPGGLGHPPRPRSERTSRESESAGSAVRPGGRRHRRRERACGARKAERRPERWGRLIGPPRGRRRGGLRPGHWPPPGLGLVCSAPTYLRSRLRLRGEAHARARLALTRGGVNLNLGVGLGRGKGLPSPSAAPAPGPHSP